MTTRHVAVLTASRGDYWPLKPVMEGLESDPRFRLSVLAGGVHGDRGGHLSGLAVPPTSVSWLPGTTCTGDATGELVNIVAQFAVTTGAALDALQPDLLVVLGDRFELLGVAAAALLHRVPLVHLNGGELTEGAHDDAVRHAVTKLAHLHLAANETYAARVRSLGEESWRVHTVGEAGLDRLRLEALRFTPDDISRMLGVELRPPVALLTYHPPTMAPSKLSDELDAVLAAVERCPTVIATHPGQDPGSGKVLDRLEQWSHSRQGVVLVPALGELYPAVLAMADVMIGNSSSGLVEAATFGLPTVNVGDRQAGRIRAAVVVDCEGTPEGVRATLERALDPAFRARVAGCPNPYGDGASTARILDVLAAADLPRLLGKRFAEVGR